MRLRRRLDQGNPRQTADVYVDGKYAGRWCHGYQDEHLRWFDSDFDIHPKRTRGKDSLALKLVANTTEGRGAFPDFNYHVYCFESDCGAGDAER